MHDCERIKILNKCLGLDYYHEINDTIKLMSQAFWGEIDFECTTIHCPGTGFQAALFNLD